MRFFCLPVSLSLALLGIAQITTNGVELVAPVSGQNELPSGAVARLGAPARSVGAQWQFDPVAHDRPLSQLAYVDLQGDVIIEDLHSGRRRQLFHAPAGRVYKLKISRDDKVITAVTEEGKEYQIAISTGGTIVATNSEQLGVHPAPRVLGVSPNGKYEARLGNDCVEVHRSGRGEPIACLAVKFEPGPAPPGVAVTYGAAPYSCVFSSDSKRLAVWRTPSKFLVYDLQSRKELWLDTLGDQVVTASFSPNSREIYLVRRHNEKSVERWSVKDGRRFPDLALESDGRNALAAGSAWLSRDGRVLIAPQGRGLTGLSAWRPQTGRSLWQFASEVREICQFDFSPDCRRFLTLSQTGNYQACWKCWTPKPGLPFPRIQGIKNACSTSRFHWTVGIWSAAMG
jgi:hypothetical protein